jgi:hypothetical protein
MTKYPKSGKAIVVAAIIILAFAVGIGLNGGRLAINVGSLSSNQYFWAYAYSYPSLAQAPGTIVTWAYNLSSSHSELASGFCTTAVDPSFSLGGGQAVELDLPTTQGGSSSVSGIASESSPAVCTSQSTSSMVGTTGTLSLYAVGSGIASPTYHISYSDTGTNGKYPLFVIPLCPNSGCSSGVTVTTTVPGATTTVSAAPGTEGNPYNYASGWQGAAWYNFITGQNPSYTTRIFTQSDYSNWTICGTNVCAPVGATTTAYPAGTDQNPYNYDNGYVGPGWYSGGPIPQGTDLNIQSQSQYNSYASTTGTGTTTNPYYYPDGWKGVGYYYGGPIQAGYEVGLSSQNQYNTYGQATTTATTSVPGGSSSTTTTVLALINRTSTTTVPVSNSTPTPIPTGSNGQSGQTGNNQPASVLGVPQNQFYNEYAPVIIVIAAVAVAAVLVFRKPKGRGRRGRR